MTDASREYTMQLLATMVIADRAKKEGRSQEDVFREFRRSNTFADLFDPEIDFWMNGPDYISEEYDLEIARR